MLLASLGTQTSAPLPSAKLAQLKELPQETYTGGAKSHFQPKSVHFGDNCRLDVLHRGDYSQLTNPHELPWDLRVSSKPSCRFLYNNHKPYQRQVYLMTGTVLPTKARLALLAAQEMKRFLDRCEKDGEPFGYRMEDLYLLRIDYVSKGTIQPRIGIRESGGGGMSGCTSV